MSEVQKPTVKIYVRLGESDRERVVSFRIPDGIDPLELLERGLALDGNQAAFSVTESDGDPEEGIGFGSPLIERGNRTLTGALGDSQRALVAFLRDRGFEPLFA